MHRTGHYGVALLVYAPIGFLTLVFGLEALALLGGAVVVGGTMVPDLDMKIPFIKHRGVTHTVWFATASGVVVGLVGAVIGLQVGVLTAIVLGVFGLLTGVLAIGAHLLADALTPMGIRPLEPIDDRKYCFDVAKAANPVANYALLAVGVMAAGMAAFAGVAIA